DEGILQLTRFATPAPLHSLLEDRALGVRTLQAFDLLMPDHALMTGRMAAFGGDTEGGASSARFLNPFKRRGEPPLATWSTLLEVTPEGVSTDIAIPSYYNGKLRIMAVGVSADRAGSASCAATVKAPVVLTPQVPLTVSPGDTFHGALVVANNEENPVRVQIDCSTDNGLMFLTPLPRQTELLASSELVLPFSMKAGEEPCAAELRFSAMSEGRSYARSSSVSVRPASPVRTSILAGIMETSATLPVDRSLYAYGAENSASLSPLPLPLVKGLVAYLENYPYDCTEQLVSRAFTHLLLRPYPGIGSPEEREKALSSAISAIRSRTSWNGVALWPGGQPDALLTAYAADFLLAMREAGLGADDGLLDQVCNAVERHIPLNRSSLAAARTSAYGIWVLTREGRITTRLIENLQTAMKERGIEGWKKDVTAVLLAASQRQMLVHRTLSFNTMEYEPEGWFDELAQKALYTSLLARYFPDRLTDAVTDSLFESTAIAMKTSRYATFSAAQSSRALLAIGKASTVNMEQVKLGCADGEGDTISALLAGGTLLNAEAPLCRSWAVDMPEGSPRLFWQVSSTGFDRVPAQQAEAKGIEIKRVYLDSKGNPVQNVNQGEELTVKITVRAMKPRIENCVINDLLPGGFEMVIPRDNEAQNLPAGVKHTNRREDRMLIFADLTNQPLTFTYRIRAVNRGLFTVPPIQAEAMYDQSLYGHGASESVEVR
ncbi:MAG: alpha-2-macroglobulin family protein, partial [Mailhella sp.]|nr:alpha-2-macroglobulin family protein [Mailhella sp.]